VATQAPVPRTPLSRDRVLRAAVEIADADGLEAVTMRRIGEALGAEAMSLYYHVANKNDLLDGIVDVLMDELNEAVGRDVVVDTDWKAAMRHRILTARQIMLRHPWAPRLLESRTTMRPAVVLYHDRLVGLMRAGGFSYDLAHHALHALGSRALGFSQELFDPAGGAGDESERMLEDYADRLPNLVGMLSEIAHDDPGNTLGWCDDQAEFEFALDLILDGLERLDS
jgi:AcrR family transcriptional regulator